MRFDGRVSARQNECDRGPGAARARGGGGTSKRRARVNVKTHGDFPFFFFGVSFSFFSFSLRGGMRRADADGMRGRAIKMRGDHQIARRTLLDRAGRYARARARGRWAGGVWVGRVEGRGRGRHSALPGGAERERACNRRGKRGDEARRGGVRACLRVRGAGRERDFPGVGRPPQPSVDRARGPRTTPPSRSPRVGKTPAQSSKGAVASRRVGE